MTSGLDEGEVEVPIAEAVSQTDIDSLLEDVLAETQATQGLS